MVNRQLPQRAGAWRSSPGRN